MTLEDLINEAATSGRFFLTLFPTDKGYQASFSRDRVSWRVEQDADPVAALTKALGGKPERPAYEGLFE